MAGKKGVEKPQISRSGRVLRKSTKLRKTEDLDINKLDVTEKSCKNVEPTDEVEHADDKQVALRKIESCSKDEQVASRKIPKTSSMQGSKQKMDEIATSSAKKQVLKSILRSSMKGKSGVQINQASSNGSKKSGSKSVSFKTNSSLASCDDVISVEYLNGQKVSNGSGLHLKKPSLASLIAAKAIEDSENVVVDSDAEEELIRLTEGSGPEPEYGVLKFPVLYPPQYEAVKTTANQKRKKKKLAEEPAEFVPLTAYMPWVTEIHRRVTASGRKIGINNVLDNSAEIWKKLIETKKMESDSCDLLNAYIQWGSENFTRIASSAENKDFSNIMKLMHESWEAVPETEKLVWQRRAKHAALNNTISNAGASTSTKFKGVVDVIDELTKSFENPDLSKFPFHAAAQLNFIQDYLAMTSHKALEILWKLNCSDTSKTNCT